MRLGVLPAFTLSVLTACGPSTETLSRNDGLGKTLAALELRFGNACTGKGSEGTTTESLKDERTRACERAGMVDDSNWWCTPVESGAVVTSMHTACLDKEEGIRWVLEQPSGKKVVTLP